MNEPTKMTNEEISEIQKLQEKFNKQVYKFGHLYIRKLKVEQETKKISDQESKLFSELGELESEESKLIEKFLVKYGEGQLDLKQGVFISDKSKSPIST